MTKSGFDIDELERLLAAATGGPWRQPWGVDDPTIYAADDDFLIYDEGGHTGADAALIVAARNSLPTILTEIRELRATVATLGDSARAGANVLDAKDVEIRELRAENARLAMLNNALRMQRDAARAALGEPQ